MQTPTIAQGKKIKAVKKKKKKGVLGKLCILSFQCAIGHLDEKNQSSESHLLLRPVSHMKA